MDLNDTGKINNVPQWCKFICVLALSGAVSSWLFSQGLYAPTMPPSNGGFSADSFNSAAWMVIMTTVGLVIAGTSIAATKLLTE